MTLLPSWRRLAGRRALVCAVLVVLPLLAVVGMGLARGRASASERSSDAAPTSSATLGIFAVPGWTATRHALQVGALRRSYLVALPLHPEARGRLPVLVLLHGRGMTPAFIARRSGMLGGRPAIVVLPAGYGRSWNAGDCCSVARARSIDDVRFLSALVGQVLHDQRNADPRAVYLAGFSNGGRMAYRIACQRPGLFTAVAVVEAVSAYSCPVVRVPVPLLVVASTRDPLLRITPAAPVQRVEGYVQPSVQGVVGWWRALDGCPGVATSEQAGTLTRERWSGCRDGVTVGLDLYAAGGHTWPTGAASEVWAFFRGSGRHA